MEIESVSLPHGMQKLLLNANSTIEANTHVDFSAVPSHTHLFSPNLTLLRGSIKTPSVLTNTMHDCTFPELDTQELQSPFHLSR